MDKELDDALCKDFPLLFRDRNVSIMQSCMPWGFSCGNGWYKLIKELADKLEPLIQKFVDDNPQGKCYNCGCSYLDHCEEFKGRLCSKIHKLPYYVGKRWHGCTIPQWKRDIGQAWRGDWDKKTPRYKRVWRTFKNLFKNDWEYTKYRNLDQGLYKQINKIFNLLFKIGLHYKKPCHCPGFEHRHPRAAQVKEKFAILRFYMSTATSEMWDLIKEAEEKSATICEDCGEPGVTRGGAWIRTLCDECAKKEGKEATYKEWKKEREATGAKLVTMMSIVPRKQADE